MELILLPDYPRFTIAALLMLSQSNLITESEIRKNRFFLKIWINQVVVGRRVFQPHAVF